MSARDRKLLMLLGAGSSINVGMPPVSEVNSLMQSWAAEEGVCDGGRYRPNYYDRAWRAVADHLAPWPVSCERGANFELALGAMIGLANWVRPRPHGQALRDLVGAREIVPAFFVEDGLNEMSFHRFGASVAVTTQYVNLLVRMAEEMRARCRRIRAEHGADLDRYADFLRRLREHFEVGVYSLNYDDAALQAWPEAYVGFSDLVDDADGCRAFDPRALHARREWGFIYHLHGNVHFTLPDREHRRGVFQDRIKWRDDLGGAFVDGTHGSSILDDRSDGNEIPITTLVAGGQKLDQLLGDPFQSTYAALVRHVHEADAFLIAGYGFGDAHVNRALLTRMTRGDEAPPVMILERTRDDRPTMISRDDGWPHRLLSALAVGGQGFRPIPGTVAGVKRRGEFETAMDRVAVWHNGFLEAAERLDAVIGWLNGNRQAVRPAPA